MGRVYELVALTFWTVSSLINHSNFHHSYQNSASKPSWQRCILTRSSQAWLVSSPPHLHCMQAIHHPPESNINGTVVVDRDALIQGFPEKIALLLLLRAEPRTCSKRTTARVMPLKWSTKLSISSSPAKAGVYGAYLAPVDHYTEQPFFPTEEPMQHDISG